MVDTSDIRKQLLKIANKSTSKRIAKLAIDVMGLCDSHDQMANMQQIIEAGERSLDHSLSIIERLRKSL